MEKYRTPEQGDHFTFEQLADSVERIIESGAAAEILYESQMPHLRGYAEGLREGETVGYIESPTASGKTALMVVAAKALLEAESDAGRTPNILIVTPTIDLVHQTIGKHKDPSQRKGFAKFAPEIEVASLYTDSTERESQLIDTADVTLTTYASFMRMKRQQELRIRTPEENEQLVQTIMTKNLSTYGAGFKDVAVAIHAFHKEATYSGKVFTGRSLLDRYDVIMFDEGHHLHGSSARNILTKLHPSVHLLGLTATPDKSEQEKLSSILPHNYHTLPYREAIEQGIIAPVAALAVGTSVSMRRSGAKTFDREGDYNEEQISYLSDDDRRNRIAKDVIKVLVEAGLGVMAPCFPGGGAAHAHQLAQELRGEGVAAASVDGQMSGNQRQRIFSRFTEKNVDVLTSVGLLGEGWDNPRVKGIVNVMPRRSRIAGQQRAGRAMRLGGVAVMVDLVDNYDKNNPPIFISDLIGDGPIPLGKIYGEATKQDIDLVEHVINELKKKVHVLPEVPDDFQQMRALMDKYPKITQGKLDNASSYATAERVSSSFTGLDEDLMDAIWERNGLAPDTRLGIQNRSFRVTYDAKESLKMLRELPRVMQGGSEAFKDKDDVIWCTTDNLRLMFSEMYSKTDVRLIEQCIAGLDFDPEWQAVAVQTSGQSMSSKFDVTKGYKFDDHLKAALIHRIKLVRELDL